ARCRNGHAIVSYTTHRACINAAEIGAPHRGGYHRRDRTAKAAMITGFFRLTIPQSLLFREPAPVEESMIRVTVQRKFADGSQSLSVSPRRAFKTFEGAANSAMRDPGLGNRRHELMLRTCRPTPWS